MTSGDYPRIDLAPYWQSVQDTILQIVDLIPEDKFEWTPKAELWNARGILIHIAAARDGWLAGTIRDGGPETNLWTSIKTTEDIRRELGRTYERLLRFLSNQAQLDAMYEDDYLDEVNEVSGHWIAFHLLEHDIHHRAELLQRLAHLDVAHGIDF